jgi:hypothetical protein
MADDYDDEAGEGDEPMAYGGPGVNELEQYGGTDSPYSMSTTDADMEAAKKGINFMGSGKSGPKITPGGQPDSGEPAGDTRSSYTADFPSGQRIRVIGGGFGTPRNDMLAGYGLSPPRPVTVPLSQAELMDMSRLQNSIADAERQVASGELDDGTAQQFLPGAKARLQQLQERQQVTRQMMQQQGHRLAKQQAIFEGSMQNAHDTVGAMNGPNTTFSLPGRNGLFTRNAKTGAISAVPPTAEEKHRQELEKIEAQRRGQEEQHRRTYITGLYKGARERLGPSAAAADVETEVRKEMAAHDRILNDQPAPGQQPGGPLMNTPTDPARQRAMYDQLTRQYPDPQRAPDYVKQWLRQFHPVQAGQ